MLQDQKAACTAEVIGDIRKVWVSSPFCGIIFIDERRAL